MANDLPALAILHQAAFSETWSLEAFASLLALPGTAGVLAEIPGQLAGYGLFHCVADEAEILSLAVAESCRRQGVARQLLHGILTEAWRQGATQIFLEVACDNTAAIALYQQAGFEKMGVRKGYYQGRNGNQIDAHLYRCPLNPAPYRPF